MSFQQGLSGLNAAAKSLDVIGNNIANSGTVGFKGSQAQFADVYANSLNGASGTVAGIGAKVAKIAQQFTQGPIESSSNPLDMAINGGGFFRMELDGVSQFSRNGQFTLDKEGYIVNAQRAKLTGYMADVSGTLSTGTPQAIRINTADIAPVQTTEVRYTMKLDSNSETPLVAFNAADPKSYNATVPIDVFDSLGNKHVMQTYYVKVAPGVWDVYSSNNGVELEMLEAQQRTRDYIVANPAATDLDIVTEAWSGIAQQIIDLGGIRDQRVLDEAALRLTDPASADRMLVNIGELNARIVALQADYDAAVNSPAPPGSAELAVNAARALIGNTPESIARAAAAPIPGQPVGRLVFNALGELNLNEMQLQAPAASIPMSASLPVYPATGAISPFNVQIDFDRVQQFASKPVVKLTPNEWFAGSSAVTTKNQDGAPAGQLVRFSTGTDGRILGEYNNGRSKVMGQVVLANFANPNGLTPLGNNAWGESVASGQQLIGTPDSGSFGVLEASSVESSNVDLTAELVNMITAQRAYQANAQTIKTQDQVMQTLVNLR